MKKLILTLSLILLIILFSGCALFSSDTQKIEKLIFSVNKETVTLIPNYEERTLAFSYIKDEEDNSKSEGFIGGEFFDKFKNTIDTFYKNDILEYKTESMSSSFPNSVKILFIETENPIKAREYGFEWTDDIEGIDEVHSFYNDLIKAFTENVQ